MNANPIKSNQNLGSFLKAQKCRYGILEVPLGNEEAQKLLLKSSEKTQSSFLLNLAKFAANGVTQAFTTGKDIPYEALMGALKAAEARIQIVLEAESEKYIEKYTTIKEHKLPVCVFPIVVTDARLFECYLTKSGETEVCEVDYAAIGIRYPRREAKWKKGVVVYIFRESSIEQLIKGLDEFRELLKGKLSELLTQSDLPE